MTFYFQNMFSIIYSIQIHIWNSKNLKIEPDYLIYGWTQS